MSQKDSDFMKRAIAEAGKSKSEHEWDPKVGAVLVVDDKLIDAAHRGETGKGNHAEFGLLQKKVKSSEESFQNDSKLEPQDSFSTPNSKQQLQTAH